MPEFIHLHNHSHYSLQDAAATIEGLVGAAVKYGMKSLALTDHGVMYGTAEFYKKAKKSGIKPIIGMEAYIVKEGSRKDRGSDAQGKKKTRHYNHMILLAKNYIGYKNLVKLTTLGHTEGYYYRPRIDFELLEKYKEGLVCTSACAGGIVASDLVNNNYAAAKEAAIKLKELFGDDFYLEIQDHKMDVEKNVLEGMPKLAKELNIKLVATNDIHYVEKDHAYAHNILLLLGDKTGTADYRQLRYNTDQIYFKSPEEMTNLFKNYPQAIESTLEIDEKCNLEIEKNGYLHPHFPIPPSSNAKTLDEYFEQIARERLYKKIKKVTKEIEDRFNYELDTIKQMGYSGYFLIVQDFINAAKERGIPVGPGRGSAAGSLVAYALGITNVNPLDYSLLFERFLNPARKSMPDIDVDFADDQRGDVIDYVKQKYGQESVCQIVTFNRLSSKAVLRDVARVLGIPIPTVNGITKHIPSKFGKVYSIDEALAEVQELKWLTETEDPKMKELLKYSRILEGMNRNAGKHAAGVVITPGDVSDHIPLATAANSADLVTQFNMKEVEEAGILKMDFLGLRTLTIIRDAINLIKKGHSKDIDIDEIPLDDEKTYQLFAKGQTTAIFQFESGPMREYLRKLKPNTLSDLAAMNALYRPGPMDFIDDFIDRKFGRKQIEYLHPVLEPILKETYGIIVYQEQVIQIASIVAGMSMAEADLLRRAMGKKDLKAMAEQKEKFVTGAVHNGIPQRTAVEIFEAIDKFANYGFNKSHAVAYSLVAYQTAYIKAHYPAEFLAANLSNEFNDTGKVTMLLEECRRQKIDVLPPNVNIPSVMFDVLDGKVVFGMCAIKNVGVNAVEEIKKKHAALGRDFTSIFDLCSNIDTRIVNKRTLEGMVLAGALDALKGTRAQNFEAVEQALDFGSKVQNSVMAQMDSLFGDTEDAVIQEPELPGELVWDNTTMLAKEREALGFYMSGHPLRSYEIEYKSFATIHLGETENLQENTLVKACGVITEVKTKIDRSGKTMAFFKLDDLTGSCECIMFGIAFEKYGQHIKEESTVLIIGKPEMSGDAVKLHVESVYPLYAAKFEFTKNLQITLEQENHNVDTVKKLKKILDDSQGNIPVFIFLQNGGNSTRVFRLKDARVQITDGLASSLIETIGSDCIKYLT